MFSPVITDRRERCRWTHGGQRLWRPNYFTHGGPKRPGRTVNLEDDVKRDANQGHGQIRYGQVHKQVVSGSAHARCLVDDQTNQDVADNTDDEDDDEQHVFRDTQGSDAVAGDVARGVHVDASVFIGVSSR